MRYQVAGAAADLLGTVCKHKLQVSLPLLPAPEHANAARICKVCNTVENSPGVQNSHLTAVKI